ncbi:MAG: DUF2341 domain-containing protein [Chitinispirillaceae bacterium]|nr:DUF2341 domain-containing protein [Chitinispirillaceae bacterium]
MIRFRNNAGILLPLIAGVSLLHCSGRLAGAGSETTNSIVGSIRNQDDSPALNTVVKLFPDDYDPVAHAGTPHPLVDTTDSEGTFTFEDIDTGSYSILARNDRTATGVLIPGVFIAGVETPTIISPVKLAGTGSVEADFSGSGTAASGYLFIPGTDLFSPIGDDGAVVLDDIPSGNLSKVIHATADGERRNVLRGEVTVIPGSAVTVPYPAWKYARRLVLNTTVEGAGVTDDQYGFPLLVRLAERNFVFSEAHPAGNDLLFTKSDNAPMPCEIERWDANGNRAEIWVKIDTLFGNNYDQSIMMYWGNAGAVGESTRGVVFDTAGGFQGVWHLGDTPEDAAGDATANRYHGTSPDSARPQVAEGIIGECRSFNGTSSYFTMPNTAGGRLNFPQNGRYTVSAWVCVEGTDSHSHVIVSKGNTQYFLWYTPIHLDATLWEFADYRSESGWDLSTRPVTTGEWVLLCGVRDGTAQHLYVNGEPADTLIDYPFSSARDESFDLMIGRFAQIMASPDNDEGYCYFKGSIDEVRICNRARSAAWVRLCYMNQRTDDRLVIFK